MDTNKMRDISREQFEAWHKRETAAFVAAGELEAARHMKAFKQTMLATWEASREAVVVDMPKIFPDESVSSVHSKCVRAIEAQGLKVKP